MSRRQPPLPEQPQPQRRPRLRPAPLSLPERIFLDPRLFYPALITYALTSTLLLIAVATANLPGGLQGVAEVFRYVLVAAANLAVTMACVIHRNEIDPPTRERLLLRGAGDVENGLDIVPAVAHSRESVLSGLPETIRKSLISIPIFGLVWTIPLLTLSAAINGFPLSEVFNEAIFYLASAITIAAPEINNLLVSRQNAGQGDRERAHEHAQARAPQRALDPVAQEISAALERKEEMFLVKLPGGREAMAYKVPPAPNPQVGNPESRKISPAQTQDFSRVV